MQRILTLLLDYGFSEVDLFRGELLVIFLLPVVDPIIRPIIHTAILWIGTNLMSVSLLHHVILVVFLAVIILAADRITVAQRRLILLPLDPLVVGLVLLV